MTLFAHYHLTVDGELDAEPAVDVPSHPYLVEQDGTPVLCVIESGAFHRYRLSMAAVVRLGGECAEFFWRKARGT